MSPDAATAFPDGQRPPAGQLPLIRYSHIFSAAVGEFLESKIVDHEERLTPRQLRLLRFIDLARHHIDDVAKFLGITAPAATKAVDQLERRGLVSRMASGDDRRLRVLACSDKGKRLVADYRSLEIERVGAILSQFSDGEVSELARLLERYSLALIASQADGADTPCLRCAGYFDADCPVRFVHSTCPYQHRGQERL